MEQIKIFISSAQSEFAKERQMFYDYIRHIDPLSLGWIAYTIPDNPKNMHQKYQRTTIGKKVLKLINIK